MEKAVVNLEEERPSRSAQGIHFLVFNNSAQNLPIKIKEFSMMCKETRSLIKSKLKYFRYTTSPTIHTVINFLTRKITW